MTHSSYKALAPRLNRSQSAQLYLLLAAKSAQLRHLQAGISEWLGESVVGVLANAMRKGRTPSTHWRGTQ